MEVVPEVLPGHGAQRRRRVHGVAQVVVGLLQPLPHEGLEGVPHLGHDDEALGGDAALARVEEPAADAGVGGGLQVGVGQDHRGIAPAQLQHHLLERAARPGRHRLPGPHAPGEAHAPDPGVLDEVAGGIVVEE